MASYEQAASFIRRADGEGNSLYDHLTSVLATVLKEKPSAKDALETFEQVSAAVKREGLRTEPIDAVAALPAGEAGRERVLRAAERAKILVAGKPKGGADDEEEEEEEGAHVPDILGHARLFREAGVALDEEAAFEAAQSLGQLAKQEGIASLRFFGVVKGTEADYLVAEAKLAEPAEAPENAEQTRMEAPGTGVNEFAYYACNRPGDAWTLLPDLIPAQVKASRLVRRFFTGRLDAAVSPVFPWGEAALLRAQIARIAAATTVSPAGFYAPDEEDEEGLAIVESEEYEGVGAPAEVAWAHHRAALRRDGRCKKFEKPEEEEEDDEDGAGGAAAEEDPDADEEDAPALRGIDEDETPKQPVWVLRHSSKNPHGVASAQSLLWPGAVAVAQGKVFSNIYIGWGLKRLPSNYTPPGVPAVRAEFQARRAADEEEEEEEEAEDGEEAGEKRQRPLTLLEQTDPVPPPPEEKAEGDDAEGDDAEEEDE